MSIYKMNDLKRASIEKRTLAIADRYVHDNTLGLTNSMDFYTLANLVRNLDDVESEMHVLSLYRMDLDFNYAHEVLPILSRFQEVIMEDCEGTHLHMVVSSALQQPNIQRFRFFSQILDPQVDQALEVGLKNSSTSLVELSLTIEMPRETTERLCLGINQSHVKKLTLDQCEVYVEAVGVLCDSLRANQSLQVLRLEHCRFRDDEVADLVRAVKDHPTLMELSVRMNRVLDNGIQACAELLLCTPRLERLDLSQQNPGDLDLRPLAESLLHNRTLTHLNLQENYLKDAHIPALVEALSINSTLRHLNLENCELKDKGLSLLINALGSFGALTHLHLKENNFRDPPDQTALVTATNQNHVLQVLEFDHEDWSPPSLKFELFLNRAGRRYLGKDPIRSNLWPMLLERVGSLFAEGEEYDFGANDVVFELLQGPALLQR